MISQNSAIYRAIRRFIVIPFLLTQFLVGSNAALAQVSGRDVNESAIDGIFAKHNSIGKPGASVIVVQDGNIIFKKGYGYADLGNNTPRNYRYSFSPRICWEADVSARDSATSKRWQNFT